MQISQRDYDDDVSGGVLKVVHDDGRENLIRAFPQPSLESFLPYYFILENENARLALRRAREESLRGARVDWGLETLLL